MLDEPFQGLTPALAPCRAEALRALRDGALALVITESDPSRLRRFAGQAQALVIECGERREGAPENTGAMA